MRKNIVIVGGGFAGMTAFDRLIRHRRHLSPEHDIVLFDKKESFDFLALAPDVLAGWLQPDRISISLSEYITRRKGIFIRSEVRNIRPDENSIEFEAGEMRYEYLLLCPGGETNFFGNRNASENCMVLNSRKDAVELRNRLLERSEGNKFLNVVLAGGGYTGLEAALNAHFLLKRNGRSFKVTVVEKATEVLNMTGSSIQKEARRELAKHDVEVLTGESLKEVRDDVVVLDSGKRIENAICIWSAGVKSPDCLESLKARKVKNRIITEPDLTISGMDNKNIFLAGDSAAFIDEKTGEALRMAIMFAMGQAKTAARNIINSIYHRDLENYDPIDLGYLVPLVYGKAPGVLFGRYKANSRLGYLLHYLLSLYRSKPCKIPGILNDLLCSRMLNIK